MSDAWRKKKIGGERERERLADDGTEEGERGIEGKIDGGRASCDPEHVKYTCEERIGSVNCQRRLEQNCSPSQHNSKAIVDVNDLRLR